MGGFNWPAEQAVIKLMELVIDKGIGGALRPYQMKRIAKADMEIEAERELFRLRMENRYKAIQKANEAPMLLTNSSISEDGGEIKVEPTFDHESFMLSSVSASVVAEALRKENNIVEALFVAEDVLSNSETAPSNKPIDDDWMYAWRESACRVSKNEIRYLWGRVLAREVLQPGEFSLRALDFLRSLSTEEAALINKVAPYVVGGMLFKNIVPVLEKIGIRLPDLMTLQDIGFLSGVDSVSLNYTGQNASLKPSILPGRLRGLVINYSPERRAIPIMAITSLGQQILSIADYETSMHGLVEISRELISKGMQPIIAEIELQADGSYNFKNGIPAVQMVKF